MFNVTSVKEANDIIEALGDIADAVANNNIVPTPAAADEGKVLTANDDGTASWEEPEGGIPTPTLSDEGKVLKAVPQTQTTVAPEWGTVNEVPIGGSNGQVLTKNSDGYGWAAPATELPSVSNADRGKFLGVNSSNNNVGWKDISQVPSTSGVTNGYVLTNSNGTPTWAAAAGGGGGGVSVYRTQGNIDSEGFSPVGAGSFRGMYRALTYFFDADGHQLRSANNIINVSIMVRTYINSYGFTFKAINGAIEIAEYGGDNDKLFISAEDYEALTSDDTVYATIICVPDSV